MKIKLIRMFKLVLALGVLASVCWLTVVAVRYLRTAARFEMQKIAVSGLRHVEENEVLAHAGYEIGTNVFAVNLEELRLRVEQIEWVRHAIVQRVLPDQIFIKVIEREPIGLGRIRGSVFLFDEDAAILVPDPIAPASFPILDGLRPDDAKGNLAKVGIYKKVVEELGQSELSEVRINDAGEVSIVSSSDPLTVSLGAADFRARWIKYLQLKTQIQQQYPEAVRVDLRFQDQVIVRMTEDDDDGEQVVWDAGKKTL